MSHSTTGFISVQMHRFIQHVCVFCRVPQPVQPPHPGQTHHAKGKWCLSTSPPTASSRP